jgi:hypothetical protein
MLNRTLYVRTKFKGYFFILPDINTILPYYFEKSLSRDDKVWFEGFPRPPFDWLPSAGSHSAGSLRQAPFGRLPSAGSG